jgi:hypothetical protein
MLLRARFLKDSIERFVQQTPAAHKFALSTTEWHLLEYIIDVTRPIAFMTASVGESTGPSVHLGFRVFDYIFEKLHEAHRRLVEKEHTKNLYYVAPLVAAIELAELKLEKYFKKVYTNLGSVYGIAAILDPSNKLRGFNPSYMWLSPRSTQETSWQEEYRAQITKLFKEKYASETTQSERLEVLQHTERRMHSLAMNIWRIGSQSDRDSSASVPGSIDETVIDELDHYLDSRTSKLGPTSSQSFSGSPYPFSLLFNSTQGSNNIVTLTILLTIVKHCIR